MYKTILVTLDGTPSDRTIIEHIKQLAQFMHSRFVLLHVAHGWASRTFGSDAVGPEMIEDKPYLEEVRAEFLSAGVATEAELAYGEPVEEIVKWIQKGNCDLVAMAFLGVAAFFAFAFKAAGPAV